MPQSSLVIWILLVPLVLAVVDLARTVSSLRGGRTAGAQPGAWSRALHINGG